MQFFMIKYIHNIILFLEVLTDYVEKSNKRKKANRQIGR